MTSLINACRFKKDGVHDYKPINPVRPLQQNGHYDISTLVHDIVTKDFGYTGTDHYTLSLKNHQMILSLWAGSTKTEFAKLTNTQGQWHRSDGKISAVEVLTSGNATTNRLATTLDKISRAYDASIDPDNNNNLIREIAPASELKAQIEKQTLALNTIVQKLEPQQNTNDVSKELKIEILPLLNEIKVIQKQIEGLKNPLVQLANDVPPALHKIKESLDQLIIALTNLKTKKVQEETPENAQPNLFLIEKGIEELNECLENNLQSLLEAGEEIERLNKEKIDDYAKFQQQLAVSQKALADLQLKFNDVPKNSVEDDTKVQEQYLELTAQLEKAQRERDEALENLHQHQEQLSSLEEEAARATEENGYLKSGCLLAKQVFEEDRAQIQTLESRNETLRGMNTQLALKNDQQEREISRLTSLQQQAVKADMVSQDKIKQLGLQIAEKEKQLIEEKEATALAQESALKVDALLKQRTFDLGEMRERKIEAEKSAEHFKQLLLQKSKEATIAQCDLEDLERTHKEYSKVAQQLEDELEQKITQLENKLKSSNQKDNNQLKSQIETLSQSLHDAKTQKETSDKFYQKQNEELARRNKEVEAQVLQLNDELVLHEAMLKKHLSTPVFNLAPATKKEPLVTSISPSDMSDVSNSLKQLTKQLDSLDTEVSSSMIGPILINLAYLVDDHENNEKWIQSHFEKNAIEPSRLEKLQKSLGVHVEALPKPQSVVNSIKPNINEILLALTKNSGALNTALGDSNFKALKNAQAFKSLDACFGESLFIAKNLLMLEIKLKPIIEQHKQLRKQLITIPSGSQRRIGTMDQKFGEVEKLLPQIKSALELLRTKLDNKKFKIKA